MPKASLRPPMAIIPFGVARWMAPMPRLGNILRVVTVAAAATLIVSITSSPVATTPAMAQSKGKPGQRELTQAITAAFELIRAGKQDIGRERLNNALKALADSDYFALTDQAYGSAADAFARAGDTATATALFDEALRTPAAKRDGRDAAMLWFNAGHFLSNTNQNVRGIQVATEARRRMLQEFGPRTAEGIASGDLLSSMLVNNGQVASGLNMAEDIYDNARASLGDKEPLTWRTANNYAEALRMVGHPEVASKIDEPLLRTRIGHYGLGSIQALVSSSNVALNHLAMGEEAATMAALDVQMRSAATLADPQSEHVAQARTWIAYAKAHFHPERAMSASDLEAMAKVKDWTGAPDLLRIKAAQLAADQFEKRGESDRSLALRIDAYTLARTSVSPAHPLTFEALLGIAMARMRRGDPDTLSTFQDLEQQVFRWMLGEVGTAGNRFVAETTRKLADDILFEFGRYALAAPEAAPAYADAVSRWKTMESGDRTRLRFAIDGMSDPSTRTLAQTVVRLSGQQQELLSSGRIDDDARAVLAQLQNARQALAGRLGNATPTSHESISIEQRLGNTDALVDFFVSAHRRSGVAPEERLQAIVRRHGKSPDLLDLGPTAAFVAADVTAANRPQQFRRLHDTLIGPLKPLLAGVERLYLVPDGELYGLPFPLLQDATGRYLDQIYDVHILTRADALFFAARDDNLAAGQKALLAGGLDYGGAANQLPGTKLEIDRVGADLARARLDITMLSGAGGRESMVRTATQGTAVIHLATHGFFKTATDRTDALWRSGLLFTGSNLGRAPQPDPDDGVVYAHELMNWDLSAADLVVLSACETALGDPSRIGSVRGLPTALAIAGARRSLLTLWDVNDDGIANFMDRFYRILADEKLDYAAALRKTRIEAIGGKIKNADDPALWAAMVLFES